jgi:peptidoglycan-N-acetylmuramic acid deacetylase
MRRKTLTTITAIILTISMIAGCAQSNNQATQSPVSTSTSTPAPASSTPKPVEKLAIPTPEPSPMKMDGMQMEDPNQPKTSVKPSPVKSKDPQFAALSWYYMKKGKGKVPDFPKETKTFTAEQKAIWVGTGKKVYLTFDNGGPMGDTAKLLKTLKENDVKATFFIAGYNLKAYPAFFKELAASGQLVANHTMSHKDMTALSDEQVKKEITDFEKLYKTTTGEELPKYFRFPYGAYNRHLLSLVSDMGYTSVFWSTAMKDWVPRTNGTDDTYNDIMNNLHDGNVILMHQGSTENIEALDRIIKAIKKEGYEFALVDELQPPKK